MEDSNNLNIRPKYIGSKRLFENHLLEKLTHTHISVPITIFLSISSLFLYIAFLRTTLKDTLIPFLFFSGLLFFTLFEYIIHRYVFHMKPNSEIKKRIQYNMHGIHHEFPKDKGRLAMPPILSIILAVLFFGIFYLLMDTGVFGFLPGMLTGYASYLLVHYIVHIYSPPKNFFKYLWINHSIHHYKNNKVAFGVSSPLWDYVFNTIPTKENKK
jgi:sterol desaturase/sphingolipid hydroxylase (fatty acid hydroxylase superfamily)